MAESLCFSSVMDSLSKGYRIIHSMTATTACSGLTLNRTDVVTLHDVHTSSNVKGCYCSQRNLGALF